MFRLVSYFINNLLTSLFLYFCIYFVLMCMTKYFADPLNVLWLTKLNLAIAPALIKEVYRTRLEQMLSREA